MSDPQAAATVVPSESRFRKLAARWRDRVADSSRVDRMIADPDYLAMAAMGPRALPWVLEELRDRGGYWFPILEAFTGRQLGTQEERGSRKLLREAWLPWGRENGYIS
jgi:hypothetical protein